MIKIMKDAAANNTRLSAIAHFYAKFFYANTFYDKIL